MTGKSYTQKELKKIVDYITSHKLFHDIRGKRMWIDLANSGLTERSWQSLKETFLKRILPDINNPYYQLTADEIYSFRTREDFTGNKTLENKDDKATRTGTKLIIRENNKSKSNAVNENTGEETNSSARSSVDTVIINFYNGSDHRNKIPVSLDSVDSPDKSNVSINNGTKNKESVHAHNISNAVNNQEKENLVDEEQQTQDKDFSTRTQKQNSSNSDLTSSKDIKNKNDTSILNSSNKLLSLESKNTQSTRTSIPDSLLPNNQEALPIKNNNKNTDSQESVSILSNTSISIKSKPRKQDSNLNLSGHNKDKQSRMAPAANESTSKEIHNEGGKTTTKTKESFNNVIDETDTDVAANDKSTNTVMTIKSCLKAYSDPILPEETSASEDSNTEYNEAQVKDLSKKISTVCNDEINMILDQLNYSPVRNESSDEHLDIPEQNNRAADKSDQKITPANVGHEDIITIKSESESEIEEFQPRRKKLPLSKQKEKNKLNNLFKKTSGRQQSKSCRRRNHSRSYVSAYSGSSSWDSCSEVEYVPAPSSSRPTRKCLKPRSARIRSLHNGGLLISSYPKVYPVLKDSKFVTHFVDLEDNSSELDRPESYWRQKYNKEKEKTLKLARMVEMYAADGEVDTTTRNGDESPILPTTLKRKPNLIQEKASSHDVSNDPVPSTSAEQTPAVPKEKSSIEKNVKVEYRKDNKEVLIEGPLEVVKVLLSEIMHDRNADPAQSMQHNKPRTPVPDIQVISGTTTPIITGETSEEVKTKVTQMEDDIFKVIEEDSLNARESPVPPLPKDNVDAADREQSPPAKRQKNDANSPHDHNTRKKYRKQVMTELDNEIIVNEKKLKPIALYDKKVTQRTRTRSLVREQNNTDHTTPTKGRRSKHSLPSEEAVPAGNKKPTKYAPANKAGPSPKVSKLSLNRKNAKNTSSTNNTKIVDKTYLINENPFVKIPIIQPPSAYEPEESSTGFPVPFSTFTVHNSTVSTEVHRSESYDLLMPRGATCIRSDTRSELSPCSNEVNSQSSLKLSPASQTMNRYDSTSVNSLKTAAEHSSSNVSLPPSPELSIVETISIDRNSVLGHGDYPILNEIHLNKQRTREAGSKFIISQVDITAPLMEQDCKFRTYEKMSVCSSNKTYSASSSNIDMASAPNMVSELSIENVAALNREQTHTDTLDMRLQNLLLESAKKNGKENKNAVDNNREIDNVETVEEQKKSRIRKRCSTPHKKSYVKKNAKLSIGQVIEEERMEYCTSGRKSCPPNITTIDKPNAKPKRPKIVKDIIKVKILRPKTKKSMHDKSANAYKSKLSLLTDSGINETSSIMHSIDDSVNLIHNHSENCLVTNDCLNNSVEYVENDKFVVSINTTCTPEKTNEEVETLSPEFYDNDAQDATSLCNENLRPSAASSKRFSQNQTSLIDSSLITEDLSEGSPPQTNTWYLFSDEEDTVTKKNIYKPVKCTSISGCGSNLQQIFPVSCAVPNLSMITEASKETDINSQIENVQR